MDRSLLPADVTLYAPLGWEPIDCALAWIAFGTALPSHEWDRTLYPGFSDGLALSESLKRLKQVSYKRSKEDLVFLTEDQWNESNKVSELPQTLGAFVDTQTRTFIFSLRRRAHRLGQNILYDYPVDRDSRISRIGAEILRRMLIRKCQRNPLWSKKVGVGAIVAYEKAFWELCRALGSKKISAYGWQSNKWLLSATISEPRTKIPNEIFNAPVSFDRFWDLIPVTKSDRIFDSRKTNVRLHSQDYEPLFSQILIPSDELLSVWPAPPSDKVDSRPEVSTPATLRGTDGPRSLGGRPPRHDWKPFNQEVVARLALDAGDLKRGELYEHMKRWALDNMDTTPDDRTVEKMVAELLRPGVIPD
ncbi:hypothetical protein [Paracraurococcus ruber]|uniref:hypothetical protein n=1 Tax=Paracraurococcus ruber TaxID=77675 RepID=UPI0010577B4A|nr:hypothetical protein [Paracraurococcus ruber]TDG30608.1 hypothetical protein E2C05_13840 [Paracraurococcus ruber]